MTAPKELFDEFSNHEKLLVLSENFLRASQLLCVKSSGDFLEASQSVEYGELKVTAEVKWPRKMLFVPVVAELIVDRGDGGMSIRVNRDWKDEQVSWVEDSYADFIIDQFVELHPLNIASPAFSKTDQIPQFAEV